MQLKLSDVQKSFEQKYIGAPFSKQTVDTLAKEMSDTIREVTGIDVQIILEPLMDRSTVCITDIVFNGFQITDLYKRLGGSR